MNPYLLFASLLFLYMNFWFVLSLIKKRNDVADVAWGMGFVLIAWTSFFYAGTFRVVAMIANLLVTIWGVRLAVHIYRRNRNKKEDYRYQEWRQQWGKFFLIRSYLQVYLLQGLFLFLISLALIFINLNASTGLSLIQMLGVLVWIVGFYFESTGDAQLAKFVSNPENKGKIMQTGLWKYSRHPNYFGEITQWWGIFLIALGLSGGYVVVISPLVITFLICFVSGVPLLERKYAGRPDFEEYKRKTSVLIPIFPKAV